MNVPNQKQAPLLELREATVQLQTGAKVVPLLKNINLTIQEDEIVAILGPSGSGKSTLVRTVAGLLKPRSGEILYRGLPLAGVNGKIGMVFQTPALFPWMTVQQNIELGLERQILDPAARARQVAWAVDRVGVDGYEEAYPKELSSGMKQRVGLARALAAQPELLCLDEPFSALDVLTAESLRNELLMLWQNADINPKAILLVTHNIHEAVFLANRILILSGKPTRVKVEVLNALAYPRDYNSEEFQLKVAQIHDIIAKDVMPDELVVEGFSGRFAQRLAPLPRADVGQIIGLLESLDDHGGRLDVFDFISETHREYSQVLMVVNAAEMLGFVRTPKDQVEITALGRQLLKSDVNKRKILFNLQLQAMKVYTMTMDMVSRAPGKRLSKEALLEQLVLLFPSENPNQLFSTIVSWGRFGELLGYSARKGLLYVDKVFLPSGEENPEYLSKEVAAVPPLQEPLSTDIHEKPAAGETKPGPE